MRVPADIVTGYLGSGKTTLLRHVLEHGLCGERVAVVVNDVAAYGIDGRVIAATTLPSVETVLELDNGCLCCSVDARFEYAMQDIVDNLRPDLVVIEASGVADPRLLLDKLEATMLSLDAVITVVDCEHASATLAESEAARGQVAEADFLVLNKTDLAAPADVDSLAERLERLNPRALRLRTAFGRLASPLVFGSSVRLHRQREGRPASSEAADGIETVSCQSSAELRRPRFTTFLEQLPAEVYRAKGLLRFDGEAAPVLFNYVRGRVRLEALPLGVLPGNGSQAVFLGRGLAAMRERIEAAFLACAVR